MLTGGAGAPHPIVQKGGLESRRLHGRGSLLDFDERSKSSKTILAISQNQRPTSSFPRGITKQRWCPNCNGYLGIVGPEQKVKIPLRAINGRRLKCGYRLAWVVDSTISISHRSSTGAMGCVEGRGEGRADPERSPPWASFPSSLPLPLGGVFF